MLSIVTQFRPKQAVEVPILSPVDLTTPTGVTFTLCGRYTEAFDAAQAAARPVEGDAETKLRTLIAHCVIGWTGAVDEAGEPVPVSPAAVLETFAAAEWLYVQVQRAFLAQTRFFEPAKTS